MKVSHLLGLVAFFHFFSATGHAAAIASFDGGADSVYNLEGRGGGTPPSAEASDGNPGGFLQLTANVGDSLNFVAFDQTDPGTFPASTFRFDFRIDLLDGNGGADGFSFSYLDTSVFQTVGPLGSSPFTPEDPASFGVLGFGFDTWGNGTPTDANGNQGDYSEITIYSGGIRAARIDDTRVLPTPFNLKDGAWHHVDGAVDFQRAKVSLTFDGIPLFTDLSVEELAPFDSRIVFAGRTGGANERTSIDNINVQWGTFIPEPSSSFLLGIGALLGFGQRFTARVRRFPL